jgi:SAM-dependent methyltransferase
VHADPTLAVYDAYAAAYCAGWLAQREPTDLHEELTRWFVRGGRTADIGCGSGREVAWLNAHGFPAEGFDASHGLLAQARLRFPDLTFKFAALPDLVQIGDAAYDNVLCETVLMHLPRVQIGPAVENLKRITAPAGVLYLSVRLTEGPDTVDENGRRFSAFPLSLLTEALTPWRILGTDMRPGRPIGVVAAQRPDGRG